IDLVGSSIAISSLYGATIHLAGTVQFSGGAARLVDTGYQGIVTINGVTLRLNSASAYVFYANLGGFIRLAASTTVVVVKNIAVTATLFANDLGIVNCTASQVTWDTSAGTVTGQRYKASLNG